MVESPKICATWCSPTCSAPIGAMARYLDLAVHGDTISSGGAVDPPVWVRLVERGVAAHDVVLHVADGDDSRFVQTDRNAPNGRIVAVDLAAPDPDAWITLVAETEHALEWSAALAGTAAQPPRRGLRSTHPLLDRRHRARSFPPGARHDHRARGSLRRTGRFLGYQSFVEPPTVCEQRTVSPRWAGSEPLIDRPIWSWNACMPCRPTVPRSACSSSVALMPNPGTGRAVRLRRLHDQPHPDLQPGPTSSSRRAASSSSPTFEAAGSTAAVARAGVARQQAAGVRRSDRLREHLLAEGIATAETLGIRGGLNGGLLTAATMLHDPSVRRQIRRCR